MIATLRAPETTHSVYGASSAHRWGECPGSVALSEGKVDKGSKYAVEGTAAHTLAAECLTKVTDAKAYVGTTVEVEQAGLLHKVEIDADMATHVQTYLDFVRELAGSGMLFVEQPVDYSHHLGLPPGTATGTADAIILQDGVCYVVDLKYGRGEEVAALDNDQLLLYAAGAQELIGLLGDDPFNLFTVYISQPRISAEPSSWRIPVDTMRDRLAALKQAVVHAEEARTLEVRRDPKLMAKYLNAGESSCRWCKAKATCPALARAVKRGVSADPSGSDAFAPFDAAPLVAADVVPPTEDNDDAVISSMMKVAPLVELWLSAVRAEVERRLLDGRVVEGFKLVQGRAGSRKWVDSSAVEAKLKTFRLKVEEMYDLSLISPTTAEKRVKANVIGPRQWAALQPMITRAEGALSVAPENDKRPAVNRTPAAEAFALFDDLV